MIETLKKIGLNQSFKPIFISIFINPFYFIRLSLYKSIRRYSKYLSGRMLDFGCGRKPYKYLFNVQEYIGVDIENSGHDHMYSEVDVYYDGKKIPFEDNSFDSLFSSEVFEHVFNQDEILSEFYRILKINGIALITTPFIWPEHEAPFDNNRYTSFGIRYLFEKHGFEIISFMKTGHYDEVIFQLIVHYIYTLFKTKNKYLNVLFTILFVSPFNILFFVLSFLLPKRKGLYFNNVILVKKKSHLNSN